MDAKTHSGTDTHAPFKGRVEDNALVRGHGRYVADAPLPNQACPNGHARSAATIRFASMRSSMSSQAHPQPRQVDFTSEKLEV